MSKQTLRRPWDWYAVLLLLALVSTAAVRLSITDWTSELDYVETIAALGAILGIVLGYSKLKGRSAGWLALAATLVVIPLQVAHVIHGQAGISEILSQEWVRLGQTFHQIFTREPVYDPIFFVTLVSSLYWWVGLHCGYQLMRGTNLLSLLLPPTVPLLMVQYYDGNDPNRLWMLAVYFLLVLLLAGRINSLRSREKWGATRIFSGAEAEFDLGRTVLALSLAMVLFAWLLPAPSAALPTAARIWQRINEPYQTALDWINQTLDAVRGRTGNGMQAYGSTLALGLRANQGAKTVFHVESLAPPTVDVPRYYWQMRIYDTYEQDTWGNSHKNWSRAFAPEDPNLPVFIGQNAQIANFQFRWEGDASTLLAAPAQPVWVSLTGAIQYEDAQPGQLDLTSWRIDPYLQNGTEYTARAQLLTPTIAMLRSANAKAPEWVNERYLQIPANLPQDIQTLARSLTENQPTQYDKVNAITEYLRREIKYSPNIPAAPSDVDPLDWFLFTWKSGYCNYFATSEVLMLRSVGIPARMAVGYAEGQREPDGWFNVRERDSHAWPQVYFSTIGWVDFEPTPSQPTLVRPAGSANPQHPPTETGEAQGTKSAPQNGQQSGQNSPKQNGSIPYQSIGVWVIILAIVSVTGYGIWRVNRRIPLPRLLRRFYQHYGFAIPRWVANWERLSNLTPVERSFQTINQSLMWLGKPQRSDATPAERAEMLKTLLPALAEEIEILKQEHENTLFSQIPGNPLKATRAAWTIRSQTAYTLLRRFIGAKDE